jgi:large subunit ribosomal protein L25
MPIKLQAKLRQKGGLSELRNSGFVPGVVYGKGIKNIDVSVGNMPLDKAFREAGESTLLELEVEGDKTRHVIINEVQVDPIKGKPVHVDFLEVRLDQKIKAEVPLAFIGVSPAVKELGGVLVKNIQHIEVEAFPQDLPHNIEIDISSINTFEDHIKIGGIKINPKVKILSDVSSIVASVVPPRSEEELESLKGDVVEDVSKVEGVVKEEPAAEGEAKSAKESELKAKESEERKK